MEVQHKKIPILGNSNYVDIKENLKILRIEKFFFLIYRYSRLYNNTDLFFKEF